MKKGLTLIELMVVIGILGILVSVMLGVFGGSTESARTSQCMANMRNLAMAVQSTAMAGGSIDSCWYPFAGSFKRTKKSSASQGWVGFASDTAGNYPDLYISDPEQRRCVYTNGTIWASMNGNTSAYVCPEHMRYAREKQLGDPLWSYVMNAYFGWSGNPKTHGIHYTSFKRADRYLLFAELAYSQPELSGDKADPVLQYPGCKGGGEDEILIFHHKDGKKKIAPVCFADGHIEKLFEPSDGDAKDLTKWLCNPRDSQGDFDIKYTGKRYEQVRN